MKEIAHLIVNRIEDMIEVDRKEGKTKSTLEDYICWALEELLANDVIVVTKRLK